MDAKTLSASPTTAKTLKSLKENYYEDNIKPMIKQNGPFDWVVFYFADKKNNNGYDYQTLNKNIKYDSLRLIELFLKSYGFEIRFNEMTQQIEYRAVKELDDSAEEYTFYDWRSYNEETMGELEELWTKMTRYIEYITGYGFPVDFVKEATRYVYIKGIPTNPIVERLKYLGRLAYNRYKINHYLDSQKFVNRLLDDLIPNKEHAEKVYSWMVFSCLYYLGKANKICLLLLNSGTKDVIEGKDKGSGKSTLARFLCEAVMNEAYFSNSTPTMSKDDYGKTASMFIWNFDEIDFCLNEKNNAHFKNLITTVVTNERLAYRKNPVLLRAYCLFVGTGNLKSFLNDRKGDRRYLPCFEFEIDAKKWYAEKDLTIEMIALLWGFAWMEANFYLADESRIEALKSKISNWQDEDKELMIKEDWDESIMNQLFEFTGNPKDRMTKQEIEEVLHGEKKVTPQNYAKIFEMIKNRTRSGRSTMPGTRKTYRYQEGIRKKDSMIIDFE